MGTAAVERGRVFEAQVGQGLVPADHVPAAGVGQDGLQVFAVGEGFHCSSSFDVDLWDMLGYTWEKGGC